MGGGGLKVKDERELTPPEENLTCSLFFPKVSVLRAMLAKYWITFLVFSVFPAPDSPLVG